MLVAALVVKPKLCSSVEAAAFGEKKLEFLVLNVDWSIETAAHTLTMDLVFVKY